MRDAAGLSIHLHTHVSFHFRHLDISNNQETIYADPNRILARIVEGLPNLVSLDISGTNLAGNGSYESASSAAESRSRPIPASSRGLNDLLLNGPSPGSPLPAGVVAPA